jgi:hypothetical protein
MAIKTEAAASDDTALDKMYARLIYALMASFLVPGCLCCLTPEAIGNPPPPAWSL